VDYRKAADKKKRLRRVAIVDVKKDSIHATGGIGVTGQRAGQIPSSNLDKLSHGAGDVTFHHHGLVSSELRAA
jgi:hypothetical protein